MSSSDPHREGDIRAGHERSRPARHMPWALRVRVALIVTLVVVAAVGFVWRGLLGPRSSPGPSASSTASPSIPPGAFYCPPTGSLPAAPGSFTVTVLNGSSRNGLAAKTSEELTTRGYKVANIGNASAPDTATVLRFGPSGYLAASSVSVNFPQVTFAIDKRSDNSVDIVLGPEFTQLAPRALAKTALQKAVNVPKGCVHP
ncbi:LytR C-terminal domain-containing protein [Devriesea agamarum]|uniref:LytR C-terminal domain-containing protein n=1 Tax=Devriesea agamarum TaxID=472569 RepID=UPI00071D205B|nr:LytR C-terminal domain-containing protein [Devriesea agamarum]